LFVWNFRSSVKIRSGPETIDPSAFIQEYSNEDTIPYLEDENFSVASDKIPTEYNTSYSKSSRTRAKELLHTTASAPQPQTGFTFVVEPNTLLHEHLPLINEDATTHGNSVKPKSESSASTSSIPDKEPELPGVPFLDVANVNLLTRSANLPPPARPPAPKFLINERQKINTIPKADPVSNSNAEAEQPLVPQQEKPKAFLKSDSLPSNFDFVPNLKLDKREKPKLKSRPNTFSKSESLPPGFGSELDAMKEAMEFAQARLKTAKELHEKRREGKITELPLKKKNVKEENLEGFEGEKPRVLRSISLASNISKSQEFMKIQGAVMATQGTRELEKSGKWRSDEEFHELTSIEPTKERESKVEITVTETMVETNRESVQNNGLTPTAVELNGNLYADLNATENLERAREIKFGEDLKREEKITVGALEILAGSQEPKIEKEPVIIQSYFELEKETGEKDAEILKEDANGMPDTGEAEAETEGGKGCTMEVGKETEDGDGIRLDEEMQRQQKKVELEEVSQRDTEIKEEKERTHRLKKERERALQLEEEKGRQFQMESEREDRERREQERIMEEEEERLEREGIKKLEEQSERERLEKEKEEKQRKLAEERERERLLEEERQEKLREEMVRELEGEKERERKLVEEIEKEREWVRKLEEEREREREREIKLEEEKQRGREMVLKLEKEKDRERKLEEEIEKERERIRKLEEEREQEREKVRKLEEERVLEREIVRKLEEEREQERERIRKLEEEREKERMEKERERKERERIEKEMEQRERERLAKEREQKEVEKKLDEEKEKQRMEKEKEKEEREKQRRMEKEREEKEMAMRLEAEKRRSERERAEEREKMMKLQGEKTQERTTEARKLDEGREHEKRMKEKERKTEGRKSDEEREKAWERKSDEERERERVRKARKEREIVEREREREEEERKREREKDRLAMERAATQERAERVAMECISAARLRAVENREEMNTRGGGEGFEKKRPKGEEEKKERDGEKNAREARLRAERAAVERATAEARERAIEKAKADAEKERDRLERFKSFSRISSQVSTNDFY
jgi:hypothetical protein